MSDNTLKMSTSVEFVLSTEEAYADPGEVYVSIRNNDARAALRLEFEDISKVKKFLNEKFPNL